jgi:hypothetical protein
MNRTLVQNIVLSGGSTMFDHFGQRLKRDLKKLVDQRIEASEVSSKSLIRVCLHPSLLSNALTRLLQSTGVEVNVISHKRQRYAVWYGGALLASLVRSLCVSCGCLANREYSPTSTLTATPRHSMKRLVPVSAGDMQSLVRPQASVRTRNIPTRLSCLWGTKDVELEEMDTATLNQLPGVLVDVFSSREYGGVSMRPEVLCRPRFLVSSAPLCLQPRCP